MSGRPRGGLGRGLGALIPSATPSGPAPAAPTVSDPGAATAPETRPQPRATPASMPAPVANDVEADLARASGKQLAPVPGARFAEIEVDAIVPNPRQPRQVFDEESLDGLKASISEVGFLQPIVVRQAGDGAYELVMGERRWRAARELGLESIPAIVRDTRDDAMLRDALIENIHRVDLNPLEEAAAYQQLLDEFGATHEELGRRIGRSRPQISNTIRLLQLPAPVQKRVAAGVLSAGHARALLSLEEPEEQEMLAARIVAEGLSVRATEEAVSLALAQGAPAKRAVAKRVRPSPPGFTQLADRLSDYLDTRVRVDVGRRKGRILIEFATPDDLDRIVTMITPRSGRGG